MPVSSLFGRGAVPVLLLLLASCAGQAPPSGGPVDTDPPRILSAYPAPNTTFFKDNRIAFEFDEYVDHRSVEGSIFISPFIEHLEYDWSGREVEILFEDTLRENTTYVVTVGTDAVDLHNRNRMAQAFTLAFSTGGQIDQGAIAGRVFPLKPSDSPSGVMIFAYGLSGLNPDTLNPRVVRPEYITQTGKDGDFVLNHLVLQPYRLVAVKDEYKNLLYDPETDEFGVPSREPFLSIDDTLQSGFAIRMAKEDTTAPRLVKVTALNTRLLLAEFSEPLDTATVRPSAFAVTDTTETVSTGLTSAAILYPGRKEIFLGTEPEDPGHEYRLTVRMVRDETGLVINPIADAVNFTSSDSADTTPPVLRGLSPGDSTKNLPMEESPAVYFSEPVQRKPWDQVVQLRDSLDRLVPSKGTWLGDAGIQLKPLVLLQGNSWYRFSVTMTGIQDLAGNTAKDTTIVVHFRTLDGDQLSSIEGVVSDAASEDTLGDIVVEARNVASGKTESATSVRLERPGPFLLDRLLEGRYALDVYRDRNRNGRYDPGTVFPFAPSERFSVYADTLKLRARWPLEGVHLELK